MGKKQKQGKEQRPARNGITASRAGNWGWGLVGGGDTGDYLASLADRGANLPRNDYGLATAFITSLWAYRATSVRAQMVGATPWQIIRKSDREVIETSGDLNPRHPLSKAIHHVRRVQDAPLFQLWEYSLCIWGEAYIEKVRAENTRPVGFWWMNPIDVSPVTISGYIESLTYTGLGGHVVTLDRDEFVLSLLFNPLDPSRGVSPMETALQIINIDNAAKAFIRQNYRNFAYIPLILRPKEGYDLGQTEVDQLARDIESKWQGMNNVGRVQVLGAPMDVTALQPPKMDDQRDTSEAIGRDVLTAFGVPRPLAGDTDSAQYKANDEVMEWFYRNTLKPELDNIQTAVNLMMLPFLDPSGEYLFEFDHSAYDFITDADRLRQDLLEQRLRTTAITLYDYQKESGVQNPPAQFKDLWRVEGFNGYIPTDELPTLWKYGVLGGVGTVFGSQVAAAGGTSSPMPAAATYPPSVGGSGEDAQPPAPPAQERAAGVTNFPTEGDDKTISLRNSQYPQFDYAYAQRLKENHPDVWGAGGNERGNEAFEYWGKARDGDDSEGVLGWIREREAWAARHEGNFELAGVVAQIKWGVIGTRGEGHMKEVVQAEIDRQAGRAALAEFEKFVKYTRNGTHDRRAFAWDVTDDDRAALLTRDLTESDDRAANIEYWRLTLSARAGVLPQRLPASVDALVLAYRASCDALTSAQTEHRRAHSLPDVDEDTAALVEDAVRHFTLGVLSARAVERERARFETEFFRLVRRAQLGRIDAGQMEADLFGFLTRFCYALIVDGYADGGVPDHELTDRDRDWLDEHVGVQRQYIAPFVQTIIAAGENETMSSRIINMHARMWWNKSLLPAYNEGLARAAADVLSTFVQGNTEEKCRDCVQLAGRTYRYSEWFNYFGRQLVPCDATECGGWRCMCKIVPTPGRKRTAGRIPRLFGNTGKRSLLQFEAGAEREAQAFLKTMDEVQQ